MAGYKYFLQTYNKHWLDYPLKLWQVSRLKATVLYNHHACIKHCTAVVYRVKHWQKIEWEEEDIEQILYRDIHGQWIECADPHDGYETELVSEEEAHELARDELAYYLERFESIVRKSEKTA